MEPPVVTLATNPTRVDGVGSLSLAKCAAPAKRPGQHWQFTVGGTTNVQLNLTTRLGGCWEITACATNDGANVGTTYGCKGLPKACTGAGDCDCNGAWVFNSNGTITSVMSGKCLALSSSGSAVGVSSCTGKPDQQWSWEQSGNGQVISKAKPGLCVDDGDFPAPSGTDGNCAALTHGEGGDGPGISLVNAGNRGDCDPSSAAKPAESFALEAGQLKIGTGQCVAGLRGKPSPFGPMQLWAKPLSGGAVAVLLANRDAGGGPAVSVTVPLSELPGSLTPTGQYTVRDLYAHAEVGGALAAGALTLQAAPQGSQFVVLSPKKSTATTRHS